MGKHPFEVMDADVRTIVNVLSEHGIAVLPEYLGNVGTVKVAAVEAEARRLLNNRPD